MRRERGDPASMTWSTTSGGEKARMPCPMRPRRPMTLCSSDSACMRSLAPAVAVLRRQDI